MLAIYLLGQACEELSEQGIEIVRDDIQRRADRLYRHFDEHKKYRPSAEDGRSDTIIVIDVGNSRTVIDRLKHAGITVSAGYGQNKGREIRIANYPMHKDKDIENLIALI